jgi:nitroimidazol reductase NimA-like FMN-containing flavoprotein (pyridoxamine 5'-phosphate oxidase superfamily)
MSQSREEQLGVLDQAQCAALLARHSFGRIAFWSDDAPLILPVNYMFSEPTIVIRSGAGTKLEQTPLAPVVFEIDEADPLGTWGWSVVAQGPAFDITDSTDERSKALRELPLAPWAPGTRQSWLTITATRVSGRYFGDLPHEFSEFFERS